MTQKAPDPMQVRPSVFIKVISLLSLGCRRARNGNDVRYVQVVIFCYCDLINYRRMTNACQQKCVSSHYKEGDLTKGEAVCLDRCVAKYLDVHERLGKVRFSDILDYSLIPGLDEYDPTRRQANSADSAATKEIGSLVVISLLL